MMVMPMMMVVIKRRGFGYVCGKGRRERRYRLRKTGVIM